MHTKKHSTVVVAMSGGVDSSVSALLLHQQGYEVIGLFMRNWEDVDGSCPAVQDGEDVARVCHQIGIPYYSVNFTRAYRERVFARFLQELRNGATPNPDVLCNREIKFSLLLEKAFALGATHLATGHYARVGESGSLEKGKDLGKDQSYFLYAMPPAALSHVLFPIGHMHKTQVRQIAAEHKLATSMKPDSTGICFIGPRNFRTFLSQYIGYQTGDIVTLEGNVIGQHVGVAFYTIGQRKGLDIGGEGDPWFVIGKDVEHNRVIVAQGRDHPALYASKLSATEIAWITPPTALPCLCKAKIRYRQEDQECTIEKVEDGRMFVSFSHPQRAITPRQAIVFYEGATCMGGALIETALSHPYLT